MKNQFLINAMNWAASLKEYIKNSNNPTYIWHEDRHQEILKTSKEINKLLNK